MSDWSTKQARPQDYLALCEGAAVQLRPDGGALLLRGRDRVDFLQRMTSNDIQKLQPGGSTVTVLTSPTARILFVFAVVCRDGDLLLLPARGQTAALARHLRGNLFFMDAVEVVDVSETWSRLRLMGVQGAAALASLGVDLAGAEDGAWQEGDGLLAVSEQGYDVPGCELLVTAARLPGVLEGLRAAGAQLLEDESAYTARRVELGRPLPGAELIEEYNPLEAGLAWACADNKGCYTGQEILARQITYDKVVRSLVGLRSSAELAAGIEVIAEGRSVGTVTSAAYSPALAAPLALAVIKRPHNAAGTVLAAAGATIEVTPLPFVAADRSGLP